MPAPVSAGRGAHGWHRCGPRRVPAAPSKGTRASRRRSRREEPLRSSEERKLWRGHLVLLLLLLLREKAFPLLFHSQLPRCLEHPLVTRDRLHLEGKRRRRPSASGERRAVPRLSPLILPARSTVLPRDTARLRGQVLEGAGRVAGESLSASGPVLFEALLGAPTRPSLRWHSSVPASA